MRQSNSFSGLWLFLLLLLVSCTPAEERIATEFETLPLPDSTLLYENFYVSSGATGDCISSVADKWYGTKITFQNDTDIFGEQLADKGWVQWPEDVVPIWRKETNDGLYTLGLTIYDNHEEITSGSTYYQLPDPILNEMSSYQTTYLIRLSYMTPSASERCFSR
jgi:hypothetical protein